MRIFIDGTPILRQRTGVGQYTKNLLETALKLDEKNDYTVFGFFSVKDGAAQLPLPKARNLHLKRIWLFPREVYSRLLRKLGWAPPIDILLGSKPDLFFFTNFVRFPLAFREKSIVVVYDISFVKHPEYVARGNQEYLLKQVASSVEKVDKIITISKNAKDEIVEHYGVKAEKVEIIYPALDHDLYKPASEEKVAEVARLHNLPSKYILFLGTLEPRKNLKGVLDAYARLSPAMKGAYPLVLSGGKGWKDEQIMKQIEVRKASGDRIVLTGYVRDEDLPALYTGARLFVFPSFYEGFGMPPLEAMACGTPVITADNSSLPEVVGDAGIMVKAEDTEGLSAAMARVLEDEQLAGELRQKGLKQAAEYTWTDSAKKLLALFESL